MDTKLTDEQKRQAIKDHLVVILGEANRFERSWSVVVARACKALELLGESWTAVEAVDEADRIFRKEALAKQKGGKSERR